LGLPLTLEPPKLKVATWGWEWTRPAQPGCGCGRLQPNLGVAAPPPCSLGTFVARNGLPLRQAYVLGVTAHNAPTIYAIHSAMRLGEQCSFLVLLQSTV
jgi:hypothetical protein